MASSQAVIGLQSLLSQPTTSRGPTLLQGSRDSIPTHSLQGPKLLQDSRDPYLNPQPSGTQVVTELQGSYLNPQPPGNQRTNPLLFSSLKLPIDCSRWMLQTFFAFFVYLLHTWVRIGVFPHLLLAFPSNESSSCCPFFPCFTGTVTSLLTCNAQSLCWTSCCCFSSNMGLRTFSCNPFNFKNQFIKFMH